jgi:hypothetical protein
VANENRFIQLRIDFVPLARIVLEFKINCTHRPLNRVLISFLFWIILADSTARQSLKKCRILSFGMDKAFLESFRPFIVTKLGSFVFCKQSVNLSQDPPAYKDCD